MIFPSIRGSNVSCRRIKVNLHCFSLKERECQVAREFEDDVIAPSQSPYDSTVWIIPKEEKNSLFEYIWPTKPDD